MRSCSLRCALLCVLCAVFCLPVASQVLKGSVPPPAGSTILLPEQGFNGGVLTGVVLGPDEKPVANAQVNLDGGVPITLSGEVIGDEPPSDKKPPSPNRAGTPTLMPVRTPQDCATILQQAKTVSPNGPPLGWSDPQGSNGEIGDITDGSAGRIMTDANGRFALCVPPDAKRVDVSFADGSVHSAVPTAGEFPPDPCAQPGRFFQPAARVSICGKVRNPSLTQGGQSWLLPAVQAINPAGDRVLTTLRTPRDLKPGSATLSFVNGDGKPEEFTGGVFKILSARLDRARLHSHQDADFEYTVQFGDGSVRPCVHVAVAGPVMLVQPPPEKIAVDASGMGRFGGKIRATQVAPGSTVPFDINSIITSCEVNPGPVQKTAVNPGPIQSPATGEMKLSLTPAPQVPNPFLRPPDPNLGKAPAPQTVALNSPADAPLGPEHTMDSSTLSKYEKAPHPISSCNVQTKTPVIASVEGVSQPTVFTQQKGLNYFTIHGCNFGTTPGHVYLVLHPDDGPGFPQAIELYRMQGNNPWTANTISVYMNPEFGGYLDQTGDVLRVVTANKLTAELPKQVFHAERVALPIAWMPRSQVSLGSASDQLFPDFKTTASSQSDQFYMRGSTDPSLTATVARSVSNVGGPFTVQDDRWDFSKLRSGFEVMYATPSYSNWNGAGCDQVSGKWGSVWESATALRVQVQGCFHQGTGYFRTSTAQYGLAVQLRGPKGALPWPSGLQ